MLKRFSLLVVAAGLLTGTPAQAGRFSINTHKDTDVLVALFGISAAALAGYGIYSFFDWLLSPSNEKVLGQAKTLLGEVEYNYLGMRDLMLTHLGADSALNPSDYSTPLLEALHEKYLHKNTFAVINELKHYADKLSSLESTVIKRIRSLEDEKERTPAQSVMLEEFRKLTKPLNKRASRLSAMYKFLHYHKEYFYLKEKYVSLYGKYSKELGILPYYAGTSVLNGDLANAVMSHHNGKNEYPILAYYTALESDISSLGSHMNSVHVEYEPLSRYATALHQGLKQLSLFIRSSDRYATEWHMHQLAEMNRRYAHMQADLQRLILQQQMEGLSKVSMQVTIAQQQKELDELKTQIASFQNSPIVISFQ